MAYYAALLSIIELLEDILHPHRFPNLFLGTRTFKSLHRKFSQLLNSLQNYSSIGCNDADLVEERIQSASYQALDVVESYILERRNLSMKKLVKVIKTSLQWFVWKEKLQEVGQEVDSIMRHLTAMKQAQTCEHHVAASQPQPQQQQSAQTDICNGVVGFEEQLLAIKVKLCGSSHQLKVISIVGMGGIGKTTLATLTFHDPLIVCKFDFRGWVTISQDYHVVRVLRDIVKSLGIESKFSEELSGRQDKALVEERELKDHIHKYLKGRKFLIVVDDIWNTSVWDDIKHIFPNDHNESRIVLTTRLADVAEYVASIDSLYQVQFLDADASWTLLQEKAFVKDCCTPELVNIGRDVASKCRGLPIAMVVIGGILSIDRSLRYWQSVAHDVSSILSKDDKQLSNIFTLSYNHLPHHLKPCFLYMGSFPEDYEINISNLIRLWGAEGFLKTISKFKSMEEIGNDYLDDLVKRNLVIITKRKSNSEFKSCIMHDLLRDFCQQRGCDEHFFHVADQQGCLKTTGKWKVRRIVLTSKFGQSMPCENDIGRYARSICRFRRTEHPTDEDDLSWGSLSFLRILDVASQHTRVIPCLVPHAIHLKYLALSSYDRNGDFIDPSITKFQNLETLIIHRSNYRVSLPYEIWEMRWLRHLIIDEMLLPHIPTDASLRKLQCLHTLQTVAYFKPTNKVIQMIPNIRNLKLSYLKNISCDVKNLVSLLELEKLSITFIIPIYPSKILSIVFPQNLKKLSLCYCRLLWEAMTAVGCLKHLQVLKLRIKAFEGQVWQPIEEQFLELKYLLLENLDLEQWKAESTHFPNLQHLKVKECSNLKEIPSDIGEIGTLKSITVIDSYNAGESAKKIEEEQKDNGNCELQVTVP